MPERRPPTNRVFFSVAPNQQNKIPSKSAKPSPPTPCTCDCSSQLTELRQEVVELTKTLNEMKEIMYARLLFPHISLAEAQSDATEVSWDHVRPPKRPRADSALYLPDIPDGFSDSTAHSFVFKRRAMNAEKECERALQEANAPRVTRRQIAGKKAPQRTKRQMVEKKAPRRARRQAAQRESRSMTLRVVRGKK